MTIKAQRQFLWGLIKQEERVLEPGETLILSSVALGYEYESRPHMSIEGFSSQQMKVVDPDTVEVRSEVFLPAKDRAPVELSRSTLKDQSINEAQLMRRAILGEFVGFRDVIRHEPTDLSPQRRK